MPEASLNDHALTGGCLCGAVRYEARPETREGYYCHCRMCQLAFGNTRAAFLNLPHERVTWLSAPKKYASSKFALRGFCGVCGTPLSFEYLGSKRLDLSVGSLDHPEAIRPVSHFAIESRVENWHADDGLPGERLDASEALSKRWKDNYGDAAVPGVEATRKT
jgi:hypothetical protein